jgi:serine/threonine protein kinase/WD40 repeat protein
VLKVDEAISIQLLGPVDASVRGAAAELGGPRQRRLLAVLAMRAGERVGTSEVIDAVWADGELPADPREALRTYASRLRRALGGPATIVVDAGTYSLSVPKGAIDAHMFESLLVDEGDDPDPNALRHAIALWRGPALAGFEHEEWARGFSTRLTELKHIADDDLGEALLRRRSDAEAVAHLASVVAEQPLRERSHRLLMQALHRSGRSAEAVRVFQAYRHRLATDLGLDPGDEIVALERAILSHHSPVARGSATVPRDGGLGYTLLEQIGEGTHAVVYRGHQPSLDREVAIKVIRQELANRPAFIRRFEAEAHLVARLEHPRIVPLYDYWREPGSAWLVMRYLRGGTLAERLTGAPLALDEVATIVGQIADALRVAHRVGVVHRDVKPANIFLDGDGNAFLGDFGIAHDLLHRSDSGNSPSVGSVAYASPEQLRHEAAQPSTDVHGLALVAFHCLTARLPFDDATSAEQLLDRQLHEPLPSARRQRPELPPEVDDVLARATEKDPALRPQSATEFADALAAALAGPTAARHERARPTTDRIDFRNPFKGLLSFQEADESDYFGRTRLVERLLGRLADVEVGGRFVALVGPSGGGKSSAIRAGLLPALRRGGVAGSSNWFVTTMLPGIHPFDELESALRRVAGGGVDGLAVRMRADTGGIGDAVRSALPDPESELLLVIDQFEELFTHCRSETERHRFIRSLVDAVTDPQSRVRVLVGMRADFYDRPLRSPALAELFERGGVSLAPLSPDELELAIVEPVSRVGAHFEPGLVSRIIADVTDQPGALPLMQYALTGLFDRHESGVLTVRAYEQLGGLSGALSRRAEALYESMSPAHQAATRRLFIRLTTPGEGVEDTRRRVLRTELDGSEAVDAVIDVYGAARLLAFDHDQATRTPTVEVAHEALLRAWPRLREWLDEDRDGLRLHRHLTLAAPTWEASGRDPGELYRGGRLEAAGAWCLLHAFDLNAEEAAFIEASIESDARQRAAAARSARRVRRLLVGVACIAVVALAAGALAFQQRSRAQAEAHQAETERLAASAATLAVTNQRTALLVAAEAYRRDPGPRTLGAVQRALVAARGLQRFIGPTQRVDAAAWLDDHRFAASIAGSLVLYSDTGDEFARYAGVTATELLNSPATGTLVVGTDHGLRLVDTKDGSMSPPILADHFVQALALGPDDSVLVGTKQGMLVSLSSSTGEEHFRVMAHPEQTVGELGIPGVQTETIPHVPLSAIRGVASVAFDPVSGTVATAGFGYARLWSVAGNRPTQVAEGALTYTVDKSRLAGGPTTAGFTSDGVELLVADPFHEWRLDRMSGEVIDSAPVRERTSFVTQSDAAAPALVHDGRLLTAFGGGFLTVSDFDSGQLEQQVQHGVGQPTSIAVGADGDRAVVTGSNGIVLLSLRGDGPISRSIPELPNGDSSVSPSGELLATSRPQDRRAQIWRVTDNGAERVALQGLQPYFIWFTRSDHQAIALDLDHGLVLFDPTTGGSHRHVDGWDAGKGGNPWLSNDGSMIAIESETGRVAIVDVATATLTDIDPWDPYSPTALPTLAFGPDDQTLYGLKNDGTFVKWDLATGVQSTLANLGAFGGFGAWIAISTRGDLVTAYSSGEVIVRSLETLQPTGVRYDTSRPGYPGVGFSPDGSRVITFFGREMRMWDVAEHEPIGDPLPSDENSLINGSPSAYGLTVIDGTAVRWNLDDQRWPEIACAAAGRNMTRAEWEQFGPRDAPYEATCPQYAIES